MSRKLLVSYLVALYNKEKYVERAISSILEDESESFEVEVCVVDDGSTDRSAEVVLAAFGSDKRVKFHSFAENRGKNAAYNVAYQLSQGSFISILGADDEIVPGRTKLLLEESIKEESAVYGGRIERNLISGEIRRRSPEPHVTFEANIIKNRLSGGCFIAPRIQFNQAMPIPEHLKFEDWWIAFHMLRIGRVKTIREPVLIYNLGVGNDCGSFNIDYEAAKRDYARHEDYLISFEPYVNSLIAKRALARAFALRRSFFGNRSWLNALSPPYNKSNLNLMFLNIFGGRRSIWLLDKIKSFKARLTYKE